MAKPANRWEAATAKAVAELNEVKAELEKVRECHLAAEKELLEREKQIERLQQQITEMTLDPKAKEPTPVDPENVAWWKK